MPPQPQPQTQPLLDDERDPVDVLAEQFAALCRGIHTPTVETFAAAHPDHADALRALLPAVSFLERTRFLSRSGAAVTSPARVPEHLGRYRIVEEIGRGGMGIVYEAADDLLGRHVAVKILPRHAIADPKARKRFARESAVFSHLNHPHIVAVYDLGECDGIAFFVMELIDGTSLDRLIEADADAMPSLSPREVRERSRWVAGLGLQAADALAYAHSRGVLHRDIKPANLLLDGHAAMKLADFGLARLCDDLTITGSTELPGTLRYVAPETLRKEGDARSDVYSLGLTLYELLVGRAAFTETDRIRLLREVQESRPIPPRTLLPAIPRDLETVLLKAMARDPSERYESAAALGEDLQRFLDDRSIAARRPSPGERLVRLVRRNPLPSSLAASTVLFALIAAYFLRLYVIAPRRPRPEDLGPPVAQGGALRGPEPRPQDRRPRPDRGRSGPRIGPHRVPIETLADDPTDRPFPPPRRPPPPPRAD